MMPTVTALNEEDAYPAMPEDGYGWEKLFSRADVPPLPRGLRLETRVARFHNVYGPHGTWDGGREKAPAAICRKVLEAKLSGEHEIEIWGDGEQTRSFMYIDDCLNGTHAIMHSDILEPINLGSDELVTINQLVDIVEDIAGVKLKRHYKLDAPKGVRGRNSDNTLILERLDWEPSISLETGSRRPTAGCTTSSRLFSASPTRRDPIRLSMSRRGEPMLSSSSTDATTPTVTTCTTARHSA